MQLVFAAVVCDIVHGFAITSSVGQHSVSSLSFVLLVPSSTKPQEKKMPLALIKKTAAYALAPYISIYIIYTNNPSSVTPSF